MTEERYAGGGRYKTDGQDCTACKGDGKRRQFLCPECGGHWFGSHESPVGTLMLIRTCNDQFRRGCEFTFHQREDHRYFGAVDDPCTICTGDGILTTFRGGMEE